MDRNLYESILIILTFNNFIVHSTKLEHKEVVYSLSCVVVLLKKLRSMVILIEKESPLFFRRELIYSTIHQNQQWILPSQASGWRRPSSSSEQPGASDPHRKPLPPDRNRIRSPPIPASLCWGWNTKHQLWLINTIWIILFFAIYLRITFKAITLYLECIESHLSLKIINKIQQ